MKNCAVLSNGVVVNVIRCHDDWPESNELVLYAEHNPAYVGGDFVEGYFYPPLPFPSWVRNQGNWDAPVPYPTDGGMYVWDEAAGDWVAAE